MDRLETAAPVAGLMAIVTLTARFGKLFALQ